MGCFNSKKAGEIEPPRMLTNVRQMSQRRMSREGTITSYEDIRKIYKFEQKSIGHGHFGTVRLARLISNSKLAFAVKTIQKEKIRKEMHILKRELEILKSLSHPNIVKFYETYQDERFFHLVFEYCSGGELLDRVIQDGHLHEYEAARVMKKILAAVAYLHEQGIVHRDLKPENFLFSDKTRESEIKIIDFGLSKKFGDTDDRFLTTVVGTALYVAPEVLKGKYDERCDDWSLGVILYVLLSGKPPFYGENNQTIFKLVQEGQIVFSGPEWRNVSKNAKDLIMKLCAIDPAKRLTAAEATKHPWFDQQSTTSNGQKPVNIDHTVISNMKIYTGASKFKREALKVIVNMLNENEIKNLTQAFRYIDKDNSGQISVDELQQVMRDLGYADTEHEITSIVKQLDYQGTQEINYMEFIAATIDQKKFLTKEKLWAAFKHFDVNNSKCITVENLKDAMARSGRSVPEEDLREMMKEIDVNNDGKIPFDLFSQIMMSDKVELLKKDGESMDVSHAAPNDDIAQVGRLALLTPEIKEVDEEQKLTERQQMNQKILVVEADDQTNNLVINDAKSPIMEAKTAGEGDNNDVEPQKQATAA